MKVATSCAIGLLALGLTSGPALAEKADRSKPIQIEADSLRMDDSKKSSVYEGNVLLSQGTLNIQADRIDVRQDNKGMAVGEAVGNPVRFNQKIEGRNEFIEAHSNRLEYDARTEVIKLSGSAYLKQGGDELNGGVIIYDVRSERYQAQGKGEDGKPGRVRAIIQPRTDADEAAPAKP